jgi:membrane associated rhomboid family serine protease
MSSVSTTVSRSGGVAYMAHIGGFAAGALMTFVFRRRRKSYGGYDYYDR